MNLSIKGRYFLGSIFILTLAVVGAWSYTQAAGTSISACATKNGDFYLIGQGFKYSKCDKKETLLSWNTQGPKGDKGDTGLVGPAGTSTQLTNNAFYKVYRGPFTVTKNEVSTFGVGCTNSNDIAINGGAYLNDATGGLVYWDTIQNSSDSVAKDSWTTTVVYRGPDQTATFPIVLTCLHLQ